jgi:hypothetical protein
MAFTNSLGQFFVRVRRPQRYPVTVPLDEFLLPGRWEVVAAPEEAVADLEDHARDIEIILRRPLPAPAPPLPSTVPATPLEGGR